jgi:hypothetical protein
MRVAETRSTSRRTCGFAVDNAMGDVWRKEYAREYDRMHAKPHVMTKAEFRTKLMKEIK